MSQAIEELDGDEDELIEWSHQACATVFIKPDIDPWKLLPSQLDATLEEIHQILPKDDEAFLDNLSNNIREFFQPALTSRNPTDFRIPPILGR